MDDDTDSHSPAPNQANVDGKIFWDQVNGRFLINVEDALGNESTLTLGVLTSGFLGVQITDSSGVVLFDAFQTTSAIVSDTNVSGDFTDIQTAVNSVNTKGGGQVFLRNGTYLLTADVVIPENVTLVGETSGGVVLDFQSGAYQIKVAGSLIDSTGTIAINNGSISVVGTGTAFDSSWIGDSILLKGVYYTITDVADTEHLTIDIAFGSSDITGQANIIASTIGSVTLKDFSVQNSTHSDGAVFFQYNAFCKVDNISIYNSAIGFNVDACSFTALLNFYVDTSGVGVQGNNSGSWTIYNFETFNNTINLYFTDVFNVSCSNATILAATNNNVTMINCASWSFYDMELSSSGAIGIEVTSCTDIEIFALVVRESASDGIKLTSGNTRVSINNVSPVNNGGYGINIADASDTKNTITSSFYSGNASGTLQDNGTNTISANNQT